MKKIKLLPSIIMLALCLAVLGIGVYSATTGSNTISGTLTVNPAGHEVDIAVYQYTGDNEDTRIDHSLEVGSRMYGTLIGSATSSRYGSSIDLSDIVFNSDTANTFDEVEMIDIIIAVTNKSSNDVGIYFWDGDGTRPNQVTDDLIEDGTVVYGHQPLYANNDVGNPKTKIVDAEYTFYHHLPGTTTTLNPSTAYGDYADVAGVRYYTEFMHVYLRLEEAGFTSEDKEIDFEMNLNVEEYTPNITLSTDALAFSESFAKIAKAATPNFANDRGTSVNDDIKYLVLPYGLDDMSDVNLYASDYSEPVGCGALEIISVPISVTCACFSGFECLESIIIPSSVSLLCLQWDAGGEDGGVFYGDYSLESVTVDPSNGFFDCRYNNVLFTSVDMNDANDELIPANTLLGVISTSTLPASAFNEIAAVYVGAFYECGIEFEFGNISLPNATRIGDYAFNCCEGLTGINMPLVEYIGSGAFSGCENLASVYMPVVETILGYAFADCSSLEGIFIPASCFVIENRVFEGCDEGLVINCEVSEGNKPDGWETQWNYYADREPLQNITWGVSA